MIPMMRALLGGRRDARVRRASAASGLSISFRLRPSACFDFEFAGVPFVAVRFHGDGFWQLVCSSTSNYVSFRAIVVAHGGIDSFRLPSRLAAAQP